MEKKKLFEHLARTSNNPLGFEVNMADGVYFYDKSGKSYIDFIAGIGVNNLGHRHPEIIKAIKLQCDKYLHVMAYGEFVERPQIDYASLLTDNLPKSLNSVYFVNSGSEAIEGALKLAKVFTGRTELISFENSYYGGTHGALSIAGNHQFRNPYLPLLPDVRMIKYNNPDDLKHITSRTACVVAECIQGESGFINGDKEYLKALRKACDDTGALLIFDEVQTGFGRTGELFAFEYYKVVPDILVLAKALGGGMPLGAFISSDVMMNKLSSQSTLGHITTFGGHPVCCAAGMTFMKQLIKEKIYKKAITLENLFRQFLKNDKIKEIRGRGLMLAIRLENEEICQKVISKCVENGLITDSFIFAGDCLRVSPPLTITEEEMGIAIGIINTSINKV